MMKHAHLFQNSAIQPTALVSSPGFGSGVMLGNLAVVHSMEQELTAALLVSPPLFLEAFSGWQKRNVRLITPRTLVDFKGVVARFVDAAKVEGRANIFIGVHELELFGEQQALEFIDSLDMNSMKVQLVYTTYTNCYAEVEA